MTNKFGPASEAELVGVDPRLVKVTRQALVLSLQDFAVHTGVRSIAEQRVLVAKGASKTMDSKHIPQADGFGKAVDNVPYAGGRMRWEWPLIYPIAEAMQAAAKLYGVRIRWGAIWDRELNTLPAGAAALKKEVEAYAARRRAMGKTAFLDGPHYELIE